MLRAITRGVSPAINRCELTFLERQEIDVTRAVEQHAAYVRCLEDLRIEVIALPSDPDLPDSVFVEDPVVVVDEVAVIARMGAESRRSEAESMARALAPYRPLCRMAAPATLDGGDVFRAGRTLFAGRSQRTNAGGVEQLRGAIARHGYEVHSVETRGCLHLKSGACYLGRKTILINREWVDADAFRGYDLLDVEEPWAADVLPLGDIVVMPEGFPKTHAALERSGFRVRTVDVSELQKAEAGVTCMSVIFRSRST
jgi:dimethylargininase